MTTTIPTTLNFAKVQDLSSITTSTTRLVRANDEFVNKNFRGNPAILGTPGALRLVPSHLVQATLHDSGYNYSNNYGSYYDYRRPYNQAWHERNGEQPIVGSPFFFVLTYDGYDPKCVATEQTKALAETIANIALVKVDNNFGQDSYRYNSYGNNNFMFSKDWNDYRNVNFGIVFDVTTPDGDTVCIMTDFKIAETLFGLEVTDQFEVKIGNKTVPVENYWELLVNCGLGERYHDKKSHTPNGFDYTLEAVQRIISGPIKVSTKQCPALLRAIVNKKWPLPDTEIKPDGASKTWKKIQPFMNDLLELDPLALCAVRSFAYACRNSVEGVKISTVFNELLGECKSAEDIAKILRDFWIDVEIEEKSYRYGYGSAPLEDAIKNLKVWKEKRKAHIKSSSSKAFGKLMQEFEFLALDEEKYPVTTDAIKNTGELSIGTFFRKSEQYFLLNDNWELWEEMLTNHREEAIKLSNEVKTRTTYEKDLMSYFYFVLRALPAYLEQQTGKKWTCKPKLVNSASELEPPEAGDEGIARKRSALTPIVDNDNCVVEVPYASLAVGGSYGTTYCYSHDYHVLTKGFSFGGNTVMNDKEEKLNGKDDYGLMFYTLTGSSQGRGYPTFLIIFERRNQKGDTKVHFHRTHPSRSKNGDYNPIHNWIKVCYNWMAGNVNRNLIKAQQGDLFFVQTDANLEFGEHQVNAYDKHTFEVGVPFAEYDKAAKSNILGYVRLERDTMLRHTEHDDVIIPTGTYAIHQCRSWEANPKGVWSLRID